MSDEIDYYRSLTNSSNPNRSRSSNDRRPKNKEHGNFQVFSHYIQPENLTESDLSVNQVNQYQPKKPRLADKTLLNQSKSKKVDEEMEIETDSDFSKSFIGLNTFECENMLAILEDILICCLEKNSNGKNNFLFKGRCSIGLVHGCLKINGFTITDRQFKWHDLYSPETNSYLTITNQNNQNNSSVSDINEIVLKKLETLVNIDGLIEEKIRVFLGKNNFDLSTSSLFLIRPLKSQICNYICYFDNFAQLYQSSMDHSDSSKEFDFSLSKYGIYPVQEGFFNAALIENENEKEVIQDVLSTSDSNEDLVVMPCGGKDVGKSTFLRYLINSLLNKYQHVGYIDCDPGQSEFTLSSCLSFNLISEPLFGPPHSHLSHNGPNKKSYFLGHLSPNDVPGVYLHYLRKCYDDFLNLKSRSNSKIPLVVNTMGWNQGLGLCLLRESIILFKPTHVIQINHPIDANKNMPILDKNWIKNSDGWPATKRFDRMQDDNEQIEKFVNYKLITLKSNVPCKNTKYDKNPPQKSLSARDHRNIAILAYFSRLSESDVYFKPIHHVHPYKVSWSKLALHVVHSRVPYEQLFKVFNASLVCLGAVDSNFIRRRNQELPGYLNLYENDVDIKCLGFGIVRGINLETKEFYIITPEPIEVLNQVNVLCKGMLNLPLEFFYEQDSSTPSPYINLCCSSENKKNLNEISNEPMQRKYLIHQSVNTKKF